MKNFFKTIKEAEDRLKEMNNKQEAQEVKVETEEVKILGTLPINKVFTVQKGKVELHDKKAKK